MSPRSAHDRRTEVTVTVFSAGGAIGVGILTVASPALGVAAALTVIPAVLLALGQYVTRVFLTALVALLVGYMFLGRGLAHFGFPPIFIGEVVLALALLTLLILATRAKLGALHVLLLAFMGWGLARTLPYVARDGADALRDAALWGYGLFAIAVSLAIRPSHVDWILSCYRRLVPLFVLWVPVAAGLYFLFPTGLPRLPGSDVPLLVFKGGDMGVHLAAVASFLLLGLYARGDRKPQVPEIIVWVVWFVGVAIVASMNRGGLLALGAALTVVLFLRSSTRRLPFLGVAAFLFTALALFNPKIELSRGREVSLDRLGLSSMSIVTDAGETEGFRGSETWRLDWWRKIVSYTVEGHYRWTGKGFGVNLADDDGFQVLGDDSLRAPHNSHMTVLARMGVPGLALWLMLQIGFALALVRALLRARRASAERWVRLNGWLLAVWLAMTVNTTFDPYLEGPQGGIWFWCVIGLGLAALRIQREDLGRREEAAA